MQTGKRKRTLTAARAPEKRGPDLFWPVSAAVFCALAVILAVSVRCGIQNGDETFYLSETHHLLQGDRLVTDIWSITQFSALFQYLPMRLLTWIAGGTEGIVLSMRCVYAALKMGLFAAVVVGLRRYRWWALLAGVIVAAFHPLGFLTVSYYAVAVSAALAAGLLLFVGRPPRTPRCVAAGFLFACCVLAEPLTALVYFAYSLLVLTAFLRKKKGRGFLAPVADLLAPEVWGKVTAGVALAAAAFFAALFIGVDPALLWKNLSSFSKILSFHPQMALTDKLLLYFSRTGWVFNALILLFFIGAAVFRKRLPSFRRYGAAVLFVLFAGLTLTMFLKDGPRVSSVYLTDFKPLPLFLLGAGSYLLTENRDRRLFAFFLYGSVTALCMEFVSRIALGTGLVIAAPAALLLFRDLILELFAERKATRENGGARLRAAAPAAAALLALSVLAASETAYCFYGRLFPSPEAMLTSSVNERLDRGPLKGLYTIPMLREEYEAILADMDTLMKDPPESLFVMGYCAWGNLYTELPYACPAVYAFNTPESRAYLDYYWELYPDRRSDCVYIPFLDDDEVYDTNRAAADEKLAFLRERCDCEAAEGALGYIVRVSRWY